MSEVIAKMNVGTIDFFKKWGPFAVLFVSLLVFMLNGYEKREEKLMKFLDTQTTTNAQIATTLEKLDIRMCSIEDRLKGK